MTGAIERTEEVAVRQRRLDSVLREHASDRTIHFLKVDVEGAERDVFASSDWDEFRPIVVVAEAVASWSTTPTHEAWEGILTDAGYRFAAFDGINRFYVEENHEHLIPSLAYPVSALDRYVPPALRTAEVKLEHALRDADAQRAEAEELRGALDRADAELAEARHALDVVHGSRTWRAGRMVATAARPALALADRLGKGRSR